MGRTYPLGRYRKEDALEHYTDTKGVVALSDVTAALLSRLTMR